MASRRKSMVPREDNGRRQREREYPPAQVKRLRDAAMVGLRDQEWGTEIGRLYLGGIINEIMYSAGKRYAECAARYRRFIAAFPIRTSTGERVGFSQPPDPDSDAGKILTEQEKQAAKKLSEADTVLANCDAGVGVTVRRVCEDGEIPGGYSEVLNLRIGLLKLADHWNLTRGNKSGTRVR